MAPYPKLTELAKSIVAPKPGEERPGSLGDKIQIPDEVKQELAKLWKETEGPRKAALEQVLGPLAPAAGKLLELLERLPPMPEVKPSHFGGEPAAVKLGDVVGAPKAKEMFDASVAKFGQLQQKIAEGEPTLPELSKGIAQLKALFTAFRETARAAFPEGVPPETAAKMKEAADQLNAAGIVGSRIADKQSKGEKLNAVERAYVEFGKLSHLAVDLLVKLAEPEKPAAPAA